MKNLSLLVFIGAVLMVSCQGPRLPTKKPTPSALREKPVSCPVCNKFMQVLENELPKSPKVPVPDVLVAAILDVCSNLGVLYSTECNYLMRKIGVKAKLQILDGVRPRDICKKLNVC